MLLHLLVGPARAQDVPANPITAENLTWLYEKGYTIGTGLIVAIVTLVLAWMVSKWAAGLVRRMGGVRSMDPALTNFLAQMAQYTVLAMGVISALGTAGIETTSILAIFTSAGLAVGLALQGSLSNFASGVMILFFKPFTIGDAITAAGETGTVVDIGMFATTLVNPSNHKIIIGNSSITGSNITNYTTLGKRRTTVEFGVAYGSDIQRVLDVALAAAKGCAVVVTDPAPPAVAFTAMASSSLNFACHSWSAAADHLACQHQVRTAIYNALNAEGIEIPFDQVVVHQAPAA
ncbi:MAG: mechanosensitive ion channel family protein [Alphaproteobacteria bacterium]|nr:mechanosensitive ion channel family protein [Alphaproteobacteria bacterium]